MKVLLNHKETLNKAANWYSAYSDTSLRKKLKSYLVSEAFVPYFVIQHMALVMTIAMPHGLMNFQ